MTRLLTLDEAAALIPDGCTLALGGMTLYRRPVAFVRALLRRQPPPRDLTLLSFTAGYESDLLVGAGCVGKVRTCYFGLSEFGFAPRFTELASRRALTVSEETEASLVYGLRAATAGIGFMPASAWAGTDLLTLRPDVRTITDPYTGATLTAFPAIPVDVAALHALEADADGNVLLNNNLGIDLELVYAAQTVIVTAERLVSRVAKSPDGVVIPAPGATVIAEAPGGAWPTSCYPLYPIAGAELMRYVESGGLPSSPDT